MKSDPSPDAIFGHGFADLIDEFDWEEIIKKINETTLKEVDAVLNKASTSNTTLSPYELGVLISPVASIRLEEMAQLAKTITDRRFGKTISLYIPMYVGNACTNKCVYCGFNHDNEFTRTVLDLNQVIEECKEIKKLGPFQNLLIVAGEYPSMCGVDYLEKVLQTCRPYFHNLTLEVQPMKAVDYNKLRNSGLYGVVCFQETYNKKAYKKYHPHGMKSHFDWRLNGFDRMGEAGLHKIGLGALLGLEDWHGEAVMIAHHLRYLQKKYWRSRYSLNFPRLRPSESGFKPNFIVSDRDIVQLSCAFRIFDPDLDISFSTRENPQFRDAIIGLGVTSLSAGSKTEPGGYSHPKEALKQFEINDDRTPQEVALAIRMHGYDPVWKDWDAIFDK
ncbi:MAG: 2-iminoacetate synthase ThiH [Muribaculaceae bacterium]|nr:2-iminoacetate synthase ThiH [Muribaculaceae bacterium]